jgi:hypothetical protein
MLWIIYCLDFTRYPFAPVSILTLIERKTIPRTHGIDNTIWRVAEPMNRAKKTIKLTIPDANKNEKINE